MKGENFTDSLLNELESETGGSFLLENENGRAMLTIYPAGDKGKKVEADKVRGRIELLGIQGVHWDAVEREIEKPTGKKISVGIWPASNTYDASAEVHLSGDSMQAVILLHPPGGNGRNLNEAELKTELNDAGVIKGILEDVVKQQAANPEYLREVVIARGTQPVHGRDGSIDVLFATSTSPHPRENEKGQVDHRELGIILSAKAGDVLAHIIPPEPGTDGYTVDGRTLSARKGSDAKFLHGRNTSVQGERLVADIDGRPVIDRFGEIRVDEIIHLEHVDYSTGNIDFPGSIVVEDRVADGFRLETRGSIILKKSVGAIYLKADGDIILAGGFMGRGKGMIESGGDIYARFVEQGRLKASGSIIVSEAIMHSHVIAGENIDVTNGRGDLIGGETIAGNSVLCRKLGARVETPTKVTVGTPPEILQELHSLRETLEARREMEHKVKQVIQHLREKESRNALETKESENLPKLVLALEKYEEQILSLEQQFQAAENSFEPVDGAYVQVSEQLYPKVEINLGKNRYYRSSLKPRNGKMAIFCGVNGEPMEALEPPRRTRNQKNQSE